MIDFVKLQRDAISADCAARMLLFIMQGGVERQLQERAARAKAKRDAERWLS